MVGSGGASGNHSPVPPRGGNGPGVDACGPPLARQPFRPPIGGRGRSRVASATIGTTRSTRRRDARHPTRGGPWSGDLATGRGTVSAVSSGCSRTCRSPGRHGQIQRVGRRAPKSYSRRRTRRASRWPCRLGWAGPAHRRSACDVGRGDVRQGRGGWSVVSSNLTVRGSYRAMSMRTSSGGRGGQGRLPDQPGAAGQRRAQRRRGARGL